LPFFLGLIAASIRKVWATPPLRIALLLPRHFLKKKLAAKGVNSPVSVIYLYPRPEAFLDSVFLSVDDSMFIMNSESNKFLKLREEKLTKKLFCLLVKISTSSELKCQQVHQS